MPFLSSLFVAVQPNSLCLGNSCIMLCTVWITHIEKMHFDIGEAIKIDPLSVLAWKSWGKCACAVCMNSMYYVEEGEMNALNRVLAQDKLVLDVCPYVSNAEHLKGLGPLWWTQSKYKNNNLTAHFWLWFGTKLCIFFPSFLLACERWQIAFNKYGSWKNILDETVNEWLSRVAPQKKNTEKCCTHRTRMYNIC